MDASGGPGRTVIPLFPLGTVLVPGQFLPLHVFEPRYRALLTDLQERPAAERRFGVVAIREGRETGVEGVQALHPVGTAALLCEVRPYPDGRSDVVSVGQDRFVLHGFVDGAPYLQGEVEMLGEDDGDAAAPLGASVSRHFSAYRGAIARSGAVEGAQMADLPEDARALSYLVAAAMVLDLRDRQRLLEEPDTSSRLRAELRLLARETELLSALPSLPAVDLARAGIGLN